MKNNLKKISFEKIINVIEYPEYSGTVFRLFEYTQTAFRIAFRGLSSQAAKCLAIILVAPCSNARALPSMR